MGQLAIRDALLGPLITANIAPIAYENGKFDPAALTEFLAVYYIPATSESMGKTSASSDDEQGIFRVSVFIASNAATYDNRQLAIVDLIKQVYYFGVIMSNVHIGNVTVDDAQTDGAYFRRDVYINYTSYVTRG